MRFLLYRPYVARPKRESTTDSNLGSPVVTSGEIRVLSV